MGFRRFRVALVVALSLSVFSLLSAPVSAAAATNMSVVIPIVPWNKVLYPEGVYEPYASGLAGTHRFTFNMSFLNFTAPGGATLQCSVRMSDGRLLNISKPTVASSKIIERLSYTIKAGDPVNRMTPWQVESCSLLNPAGQALYQSNSSYGHPLNRRILVHQNQWTRFSSPSDDGSLAIECFNEVPKRYLNNSYQCDFAGDVAFAAAMSRGMNIEGDCGDGADGTDKNGDVDCQDIYCRGWPFTCISHKYVGDPFTGICRNGLCWETKKVAGKDVTYWYTRYVKPGGSLKVRIKVDDYSTSKPISFALTGLVSYSQEGNYVARGLHKPGSEQKTQTSYSLTDPRGYYGSMDFVMYLQPGGVKYGWNTFNLYIVHMDRDLLIENIPYFISDAGPTNWDESEDMVGQIINPCADGFDNDLSYSTDCKDPNCNGKLGGKNCQRRDAYCEYGIEDTCDDCFDNDANIKTDCADRNCDGKPGNATNPSVLCSLGCEGCGTKYPANCLDGFDNDGNGLVDCIDLSCRGRGGSDPTKPCPGSEGIDPASCSDGIDNDFDGFIDCQDYDCRGKPGCITNEAYDAAGRPAPQQCFDGIDNDLDNPEQKYGGPGANIDCADRDCTAAVNPLIPAQKCTNKEFDPLTGINLCGNGLDDDGDGSVDCLDTDCFQKFGLCGPCPSYENYRYDSCLNALDDNGDGKTDCADTACPGEFGGWKSQVCENPETGCSDGFDNDANNKTDCADPNCLDKMGPGGTCARNESTSALCNDNFDNDGDGAIDCIDPECWIAAGSGCSPKFWSASIPFAVPYMTPLAYFNLTTVQYSHLERLHVNESYQIRFRSSSTYGAMIITLGDATNPSLYFPYNATSCVMAGSPSLKWVSTQKEVGQIQHKPSLVDPSNQLPGFDVTLTCSGVTKAQTNKIAVTVTNLKQGIPEVAEGVLTSTVYNISVPRIDHFEIEPSVAGNVNIPYGGSFDLRAIPAPDVTSVSLCYFNISDSVSVTPNDCIYRVFDMTDDIQLPVTAAAEDGSGNRGPYGPLSSVPVNVLPVERNFSLSRAFYRTSEDIEFKASFITAVSDQFPSASCDVNILDSAKAILSSTTVGGVIQANLIDCDSKVSASGLSNGLYYINTQAMDMDSDVAESKKRFFYVCNDYSSKGDGWDCSKADFDLDGIPDLCVINGSVTTTSVTTTTLSNYTSTTLPPEMLRECKDVCSEGYNTQGWMCSEDFTCTRLDSKWVWTHDDRGDFKCFVKDNAKKFCCCQLEGLTTTTTQPRALDIDILCHNGVQDPGELDVDCGGLCPPCDSCFNNIQDGGEEAIDCGGPCLKCILSGLTPGDELTPRLYVIGVPAYVTIGNGINYVIVDQKGRGIQAYLVYSLPNGTTVRSLTDISGRAAVNSTIVGLWTVEAKRSGYESGYALWATLPTITAVVAVVAATSILLPLIGGFFLLRSWRRRRKGVAATENVVKLLDKSGVLDKYAPVYVTEEAYKRLHELRPYLKPVRLSGEDILQADKLAHRHDIPLEFARLLVIVKKVKAERLYTDFEPTIKEFNMTRILDVWNELGTVT